MKEQAKIKLQKFIQAVGVDSRRKIREMIHNGHFKVNQMVVTDPNYLVNTHDDRVTLNNRVLSIPPQPKRSYFIFNKPDGVISSLNDPQKRPTIPEFIRGIKERVYPVGRLDYHSEGLILLTNDGDLANFIISPKNGIVKTYMIKIRGEISSETQQRMLNRGVVINGVRIKPLEIQFVKKTKQNNSWLRIKIVEGKKHIIRNLFKFTGHPVQKLKRTAIGTIKLKKLPPGHWRELTEAEINQFCQTAKYSPPSTD
jgi:pseudouridine synthase